MATTYTDTAHQAYALQARTDGAGAAVDDVTGEDLRLILELFTQGIVGADSYRVRQRQAGANMSVDVGSGNVDTDKAILDGEDNGQGNYMVRMETGLQNVTVPAAHATLARIDEVYLVVLDNAYDGLGRVLPRLAYRDGTAAGSPVAPGPDAAWDAFLKLATISVPAADTSIQDAQITDNRVVAAPVLQTLPAGLIASDTTASNTGSLTSTGQTRVVYSVGFTVVGSVNRLIRIEGGAQWQHIDTNGVTGVGTVQVSCSPAPAVGPSLVGDTHYTDMSGSIWESYPGMTVELAPGAYTAQVQVRRGTGSLSDATLDVPDPVEGLFVYDLGAVS